MRLGFSAASQRDPAESAEITIAIEEAGLCDGGSVCGTALPGQDGELDLLAPHWHKWFEAIRTALESEIHRLTKVLAGRVKELEERYTRTLPQVENEVGELRSKVNIHMNRMGLLIA